MTNKTKWIIIIVGCLVGLYIVIAGIKYICFGRSHEGEVIQPGDFSITIE